MLKLKFLLIFSKLNSFWMSSNFLGISNRTNILIFILPIIVLWAKMNFVEKLKYFYILEKINIISKGNFVVFFTFEFFSIFLNFFHYFWIFFNIFDFFSSVSSFFSLYFQFFFHSRNKWVEHIKIWPTSQWIQYIFTDRWRTSINNQCRAL